MKTLAIACLALLGGGATVAGTSGWKPCELIGRSLGALGIDCQATCSASAGAALGSTAVPVVDVVEFRSAAVWAGACHFNSEYDSRGRRALIGFRARTGGGLGGLQAVLALASAENLMEGGARTAELWLDESATVAQEEAFLGWLEVAHADLFSGAPSVHHAPVEVRLGPEGFGIEVPGVASAAAAAMADGACCTMPENRWYEPLAGAAGARVGRVEVCGFEGTERQSAWSFQGGNSAFVLPAPVPTP